MGKSRLDEILQHCLAVPPEAREQVLLHECAGDEDLVDAVRRLLQGFRKPDPTDVSAPAGRDMFESTAVGTGSATSSLPEETPPTTRSAPPTFAAGDVLDNRYRIDAYLAAGGMGQVYRAHDLELDVSLALKTIRPEIASRPASLRRFKQEVLLARSVTHTNVCRIFDLGRDGARGVSFLTMEFLPGETLSSRIRRAGLIDPGESLPLVRQMAAALDTAHRAGIVHRDFKSPNVMVVPNGNGGRAVITDFGLAMIVESDDAPQEVLKPSAPRPSTTMGTPAYMSPEQVRRGPVGPASDLYALGVVLFEMCTGQLPFREATPLETAQAHLTMEPPSPREFVDIEETWNRTILRLLSKEPEERYATAHDVVLALEGRFDADKATRYFLPAERDAFVGRTTELEAIATRLSAESPDAIRLLTMHGPGGTGKTRLAQKFGWDSLSCWPGGVWFCDLSEARTADGIAVAVARSLNVALGKEDPIVQLGHAIAGRGKNLVILDNFEQVVEYAEATLGRWLERATETSFLVTSRERLQLPQETILELEPLDRATQGVELFEVRAQGHRPGFIVDATNRGTVEAILRRIDGLPLAIELAAARLRMLTLDQLNDRLRDRFTILAGGKKGRHATLRATLDWSWDLLTSWEQSAMAQVSVFEGGFTLEAAEAVIDLSEYGEDPLVLDVIQSLVDKSWLRAKVALGSPRFNMYVTMQEYASVKLRAESAHANAERVESEVDSSGGPAALTEVEVRHGSYFAGMGTEDAVLSLDQYGGEERRAALRLELDNLVAACRRAILRTDELAAINSYLAANEVLTLQGPAKLPVQLGSRVLALTKSPTHRGRVLLVLARAEGYLDRSAEARAHYEAALTIHRAMGDRPSEGVVLGNLGILDLDQGRMEEARAHYDAALVIHREVGNLRGEGIGLANLGYLHHSQGRMDEARAHYEAALAIHREMGNRRFQGMVLAHLGVLYANQGRVDEGRAQFEAALAIHREVGNRRSEAFELGNLGSLLVMLSRNEEARGYYQAASAIHREVGNLRANGDVLGNLGILQHEQGRTEEAQAHYEAALAIHREVGNQSSEGTVLANLGNLHLEQGRTEEARAHYEAALTIRRAMSDRALTGDVLRALGLVHKVQGRMEDARDRYETALAIHREVGDLRGEGIALGHMATLDMEQGRTEEASGHFEAALTIHRDVGNLRDEGIALGDLGKLFARQHRTEDARRCFEEGLAILRDLDLHCLVGEALCGLGQFEHQLRNFEEARAALLDAESIAADLAVGPESKLARAIDELRRLLGSELS